MYAVGNLISGNSLARSAIFFYALALHAVIFLILARCGRPGAGLRGAGPVCQTRATGGCLLETRLVCWSSQQ